MRLRHIGPRVLALGLALAALPPAARAEGGSNDIFQALVKREFGTAMDEMLAIEKQIQDAKPEEFPAIEARLIAVLEAPDATMPGRQFACQMLRLVGSRACVPAVAKLLAEEKLSHMARSVLLGMNDPAAGDVLLDALKRTQGPVRIGIIHTLGDRADRGSLKDIAALIKEGDAATAAAALHAAGKIGGRDAAAALDRAQVPDPLKPEWARAYLRCADGLAESGETKRAQPMYRTLLDGGYPSEVRAGAFRGIVAAQKEEAVPEIVRTLASPDRLLKRAAIAAVIAVPGHAATAALTKQLAGLEPGLQATLVGALAARGDAEGLTAMVNAWVAGPDPTLREAAIRALGRLGDASSVPALTTMLPDATNGTAAVQALTDLRGPGVVDALLAQARTGDSAARAGVLGVLAARKQIEALPLSRGIVKDPDAAIRQAAVKILGEIGTLDDLKCLCDAILTAKDEGERDRLARAISAIGLRLPGDRAARDEYVLQTFTKSEPATQAALLPVLSAFGGNQALQAARTALAAQGEVHKAAVRALAAWPDAAPLTDLRGIAKDDPDEAVRILALRGFIKMIEPARAKTEEKVQFFREAMELATRPDEKRQVLSEIARVGHADSLKTVEPFLGDDALKREAVQAYEKLAESVMGKQPDLARAALQKVVEITTDGNLREKAKAALERIK